MDESTFTGSWPPCFQPFTVASAGMFGFASLAYQMNLRLHSPYLWQHQKRLISIAYGCVFIPPSRLYLALESFNAFLTGNIKRLLYSLLGPYRTCNVSYGGVLAPSSLNLAFEIIFLRQDQKRLASIAYRVPTQTCNVLYRPHGTK